MKHQFITLIFFTILFTGAFVACSKKDWLPPKNKNEMPVRINAVSNPDTPYCKTNAQEYFPELNETGIRPFPAAALDTPYSK
jgi:hypothetical protein